MYLFIRGHVHKLLPRKSRHTDYGRPAHGLRTSRDERAFTARPKIHSQSQIFKYCQCIFCLPHWPNFSDIFDLCLDWMSVVRALKEQKFWKVSNADTCRVLNLNHPKYCDIFITLELTQLDGQDEKVKNLKNANSKEVWPHCDDTYLLRKTRRSYILEFGSKVRPQKSCLHVKSFPKNILVSIFWYAYV